MEQAGHGCTELSSEAVYDVLRSLEDVNILIHRSPDGDCVGGGYAVYGFRLVSRLLPGRRSHSRTLSRKCASPSMWRIPSCSGIFRRTT